MAWLLSLTRRARIIYGMRDMTMEGIIDGWTRREGEKVCADAKV